MIGFLLLVAAREFTRYTESAYVISGSLHRAARVVHIDTRPLSITDFQLRGVHIPSLFELLTCFITNL